MDRGSHPGQRMMRRTTRESPGLICTSWTYKEDGKKLCFGDVLVTCSSDVLSTLGQFSALHTGTPLEQVVGTSPQQAVEENATHFSGPIGPYGMRERGTPALACPRSPLRLPGPTVAAQTVSSPAPRGRLATRSSGRGACPSRT